MRRAEERPAGSAHILFIYILRPLGYARNSMDKRMERSDGCLVAQDAAADMNQLLVVNRGRRKPGMHKEIVKVNAGTDTQMGPAP